MELHRLDGHNIDGHHLSGLDNLDIQDIDFETLEEGEISGHQLEALEALGYVHEPEIAFEILDEDGNVVMYADADENLYVMDGLGELGFLKKIGRGLKKVGSFVGRKIIRPVHRKVIKPVGRGISKVAKFTGKKILKPALKTFNRFLNPATMLLRNGFLLAMKMNMMKVASRLRFGYLSDLEARKRGMSTSGFSRLKGAISKAHKIYELAGGKSSNLKKAILTGKGNSDRKVPLSGIELGNAFDENEGYADEFERMVVEMDAEDVEALLEGTMEIEGLGAVATGTAIAAASGAVASVSKLLDKITGVFDKVDKKANSTRREVSNLRSKASSVASRGRSIVNIPRTVSSRTRASGGAAPARVPTVRRLPSPARTSSVVRSRPVTTPRSTTSRIPTTRAIPTPFSPSAVIPTTTAPKIQTVQDEPEVQESFFQKYKTPMLIGTGVIVVGGGVCYAYSQSKKGKKSKSKSKSVNGIPRDNKGRFKSTGKRKTSAKSRKNKAKKKQKELVPTALL